MSEGQSYERCYFRNIEATPIQLPPLEAFGWAAAIRYGWLHVDGFAARLRKAARVQACMARG